MELPARPAFFFSRPSFFWMPSSSELRSLDSKSTGNSEKTPGMEWKREALVCVFALEKMYRICIGGVSWGCLKVGGCVFFGRGGVDSGNQLYFLGGKQKNQLRSACVHKILSSDHPIWTSIAWWNGPRKRTADEQWNRTKPFRMKISTCSREQIVREGFNFSWESWAKFSVGHPKWWFSKRIQIHQSYALSSCLGIIVIFA